jgi:AAA15 family ATPase/GTPase
MGKNNAGKSTLVEAIRLLSLASSKYKNIVYKEPPSWTGLSKRHKVIKPSLSPIELELEKVFHRHNDPPAIITAIFSNNSRFILVPMKKYVL